ncbi:MAG: pantoate--beta-alanine ligase [Woeseiaceae bacterium]
MDVVHSKDELAQQIADWRQLGDHIALVPTMGNLHQGHLSLVDLAREHAERVIVSIFVNPTQFGEGEDFDEYPRTLELDTRLLKKTPADLVFAPSVDTMYPFGLDMATRVSVPGLTEHFCGASLVIRHMTADLGLPIKIITGTTVRDDDGLALSSRNSYLSEDERATAPLLYATLSSVGTELQSGRRDFDELESAASARLEEAGFDVDYFAIRRAQNLEPSDRDCDDLVVLAAARLGQARLIDNVVVTI